MNVPSPKPRIGKTREITARDKLVVVGNGTSACRAVEEVLSRKPDRYQVTMIGAAPRMSSDHEWYQTNDIKLHTGDSVVKIDRSTKVVICASGKVISYDRLLLATGSTPFVLPVQGHRLPGVVTFRDMDDVNAIWSAAKTARNVVVIGGGMLGLEAAHGLFLRGKKVSVIHLSAALRDEPPHSEATSALKYELEHRGVAVLADAVTQEIIGARQVEGVRLKSGRMIPADLVVMAVGIRPNTALAKEAGVKVRRGVRVDDHMVTSDPAILAVGECAERDSEAPLREMCVAAAGYLIAN